LSTIEEGQAARDLLANPLLQESFEFIESTLTDQWAESTDTLVREEIWFTLQGLRRFKSVLELTMTSGQNEALLKEAYNA
jgi:hypothetical protein